MISTAYTLAERFLGLKEIPGGKDNPLILGMLQLAALDGTPGDFAQAWPQHDETPWCAAFVSFIAFLLNLPRPQTGELAARSWLTVGSAIVLDDATRGFDLVVLERDGGGHVGFFSSAGPQSVLLLAGNQHDAVSLASFPRERVIGVRRLA
jgi:uncharacterized protein (TIGR02594 family)